MLAAKSLKRIAAVVRTLDVHHNWPSKCQAQALSYSTKASSSSRTQPDDDSIFSPSASPWDHVFEDIKDIPPLLPTSARARHSRPSPHSPETRAPRRQAMTAREINAFDEMFDMIFNAVTAHHPRASSPKARSLSPIGGIGRAGSTEVNDLFGKLRSQSKQLKWTSEADEELDRKREEMDLCETDQQLLDWAMREVFDESRRYEENTRRTLEDPASAQEPVQLQPSSYPHLIALLMRTFREKYADPHLALSIFDHARHLSIASFVFGCTTPAYNELIETRWRCFRDLRGVCDALEEMRVNGVEMDNRTRSLAEMIRREVGERNLWQEEHSMGSGEVWNMVTKIEKLTVRSAPKRSREESESMGRKRSPMKRKWTSDQELWKGRALNSKQDDWEFGRWDTPTVDPLQSDVS